MSTLPETSAWLRIPGRGSATIPMSYPDFMNLNEPTDVEYYDDCAVVSNPSRNHQRLIVRLVTMLNEACLPEYEALAEWGWEAAPETMFKPDVMVVAKDGPQDWLRTPPLLAVEVLSPSTRRVDLSLKMDAYATGGAAWYWIVDPIAETLTVYANAGGRFVLERGDGRPNERESAVNVVQPFLVGTDLLALFA